MATANMVELHNTTASIKNIWLEKPNGEVAEHVLPPHTTWAFPRDIADEFLKQYPGLVLEQFDSEIPDLPGQSRVWIANWTGNPYLPEDLIIEPKKPGDPVLKIPNPRREALTLQWQFQAQEVVVPNGDGTSSAFRYPFPLVKLPAYKRISVPSGMASMILQGDGVQEVTRRGMVHEAREPQPFEASPSWELNDLILYAHVVNPTFFNVTRLKEEFPSEEALKHDPAKIRDSKIRLWQHIFFLVCDREFGLPSKQVFEAKKKALMESLRAGKLVAGAPGAARTSA